VKGRWILAIFLAVLMIPVYFFLQLIFSNGYFDWFLESKYSIESARIEQVMAEDGSISVHEEIHYRMRKPFRGLYRSIPMARYVTLENVELWTEGAVTKKVEYLQKSNQHFEARVWIAENEYASTLDPADYRDITLHVKYTAKNVLEIGQDADQIFRQIWGTGWDSFANDVTGVFHFPEGLTPEKVYTHPNLSYTAEGNVHTFHANHIAPNAYAEVRFVFNDAPRLTYAVENPTLSASAIQSEERSYTTAFWLHWVIRVALYLILFWLLIFLYRKYGVEPEISYHGIYERELPSDDSPDVINALIKNRAGSIDDDGIASAMMSLYRKDYISFDQSKKDLVVILNPKADQRVFPTEGIFLAFLRKYAQDNAFDFGQLKKTFKKSQREAIAFTNSLSAYKRQVNTEASGRKIFEYKGATVSKVVAVLFMILSAGVLIPVQGVKIPFFLGINTILFGILWFISALVLMLPKEVYGRWTKTGAEFYQKWNNFGSYISDISAIKDYPPESVAVWEHYLVYATALGIADKVEKVLKSAVPKELWEEQSQHSNLYNFYSMGVLSQWATLRTVSATSASSKGGSGGGGFGGGAGGSGGGSGGGGGGAF